MVIDNYNDFVFKNFTSWFTELAALAEKTEDSSGLPKLELSLRSGHVIRGSIIRLQQNTHDQLLMILGFLDPYTKAELTFVSGNEVVALTLLEPDQYSKLFLMAPNTKSIGALELKRAVKNIEIELEKILLKKLTITIHADVIPEPARWDVLRTIGFLPSVFTSLTNDDLGKKLVIEKIESITINMANKTNTTLIEKDLHLSIVTPLSISVVKEKERLIKEIESIL